MQRNGGLNHPDSSTRGSLSRDPLAFGAFGLPSGMLGAWVPLASLEVGFLSSGLRHPFCSNVSSVGCLLFVVVCLVLCLPVLFCFVCVLVYLFVAWSRVGFAVCLLIGCLFYVCLSVCWIVNCLSVGCLPVCRFVCLSVCFLVRLLNVCLLAAFLFVVFVCLFVCLFVVFPQLKLALGVPTSSVQRNGGLNLPGSSTRGSLSRRPFAFCAFGLPSGMLGAWVPLASLEVGFLSSGLRHSFCSNFSCLLFAVCFSFLWFFVRLFCFVLFACLFICLSRGRVSVLLFVLCLVVCLFDC